MPAFVILMNLNLLKFYYKIFSVKNWQQYYDTCGRELKEVI